MSSDPSSPSTDAGATRSDGLVAFGALLVVIALLGVLSNGRRWRGAWRRDRRPTSSSESTVASPSARNERPGT